MYGRKIRNCVVACAATACVGTTAQAGFTAAADPGGYFTVKSKLGTQWSVASVIGDWSFDAVEGVASTSATGSFITYTDVLPEKPASIGGGDDLWRVGVTAMEMTGLEMPASYTQFLFDVIVDGSSVGTLAVPVSSSEEQTAFIDIGTKSGSTDVRFRWLNSGTRFFENRPELGIGVVQFAASAIPSPGAVTLAGMGLVTLTRRRRTA